MRERNNPRNNQILYLFLGFLVLFVLSFTLGVIVGKGLNNSEQRLTTREEKPSEPRHREAADSEKEIDTMTKEEATVEQTSPSSDEELEPRATNIIQERSAEHTQAPPERREEIVEGSPDTPGPTEEKGVSETAKIKEPASTTPTIGEDNAKVEANKEQASQKGIAALPKIDAGGKYTVQIGSFQEEIKAKQVLESLGSRGYPVFIKQVDVPGQRPWYRARVGTFKTKEDAGLYAKSLMSREPDVVKSVLVTIND
ncbi:MAG TPA: SPOR domain-containing protein [Thermodesulfobacteriota bacterium]|nr:SPOR domain-containing protein [Thermodesulfobacteriota bacterium]